MTRERVFLAMFCQRPIGTMKISIPTDDGAQAIRGLVQEAEREGGGKPFALGFFAFREKVFTAVV